MSGGGDRAGDLVRALSEYLGTKRGVPVEVEDLTRLSGGASHETWGFIARTGTEAREALILRRDHARALIDGDLVREFALLERLYAKGLAVPRPWYRETDATILGGAFMIVERVAGMDLRKALAAGGVRDRAGTGREIVAVQAALHTCDWRAWGAAVDAPDPEIARELARWSADVAPWQRPLLAAAGTWLAAHVPPAGLACLVHGDFKANNLVYGADGRLTVIDWEMAHISEAHEDLAWTLMWTTGDDLVGGLLDRDAYLAAYAQASGRVVEPERLFFWEVLALLKLAAIFLRAAPGPDDRAPLPSHLMLHRALADVEARLARMLLRTVFPSSPVVAASALAAPVRAHGRGFDALSTLGQLRAHLAQTVLPIVSGAHAGELRAALKLIDECIAELDAAPAMLTDDCAALDELIVRAGPHGDISAPHPRPAPVPATAGTASRYAALAAREAWLADAMPALQASTTRQAVALLAAIYAELGAQACRRATWQSVFAPAAGSPPEARA